MIRSRLWMWGFLFLVLIPIPLLANEAGIKSFKDSLLESDQKRMAKLKQRLEFEQLVSENEKTTCQQLHEISNQKSCPSPIPPLFHYIWVGGPLYEEYWNNIVHFAILLKKEKSPYQINLLVESLQNIEWLMTKKPDGTRAKIRNPGLETYRLLINQSHDKGSFVLNIKDIKELKNHPPLFLSQRQYKEYWNIINFELHGLRNLAAAADFLRLLTLQRYGGWYLDTDMTTLLFNWHKPFKEDNIFPLNFKIIESNNCCIACTPNHPIINAAVRYSLINYLTKFSDLQDKRRTDQTFTYYSLNTQASSKLRTKRCSLTLAIAGPGMLHGDILSQIKEDKIKQELILQPKDEGIFNPAIVLRAPDHKDINQLIETPMIQKCYPDFVKRLDHFINNKLVKQFFADESVLVMDTLRLFCHLLERDDLTLDFVKSIFRYVGYFGKEISQYHALLMPPSFQDLINEFTHVGVRLFKQERLTSETKKDIQVITNFINFFVYHLQGVLLASGNPAVKAPFYNKVSYIEGLGWRFHYTCDNTWLGKPYTFQSFDNEWRYHLQKKEIKKMDDKTFSKN